MKFGYRDRIILLVACVIIIFGIGIFAFIKPKYEAMKKDKKALEDAQNTWNTQLLEFDNIPTKQEYIEKRYEEGLKMSENFTDEMDATKLDQFLQEKFFNTEKNIKDGTVLKSALAVTDEQTASIGYYYYTPSIVSYPLYESADLDGSLAAAAAEKRKDADQLAARAAQTVGAGTSTFTVRVNKADAFEFIDGVKKYAQEHSDAMLITSVTFEEYDFNGPALERDEKGEITGKRPEDLKEKWEKIEDEDLGYTGVTVTFNVYYMQEPTKPDVGDKYDKSIWDGEEWRSFKAPEAEAAAQ